MLYKLIWDSWWERSQIDDDFIKNFMKEYKDHEI